MKNSTHRMNYRNQNIKFQSQIALCMALHFVSLGLVPMGFLRNLVMEGGNAYDGLNRGQIRQMYWLRYVVK